MARASIIQTNFTTGEMSPRLMSRVDVQKYQNGCELLENFLIMPHGGVTKRPGFRFIAATKTTAGTYLIPFKFSTVQAYIIEFGAGYFRFYMDGGQILSSGSPYECAHPYTQDQLANVKFVQSADVLYMLHPQVRPKQLMRAGHTSWSVIDFEFKDGPYLDTNSEATKQLAVSATAVGPVTITATGHSPFAATDIGRCVRIGPSTAWSWAVITSFTSATEVAADLKVAASSISATADWRLGAWSDTTGWPSVASFFEERLWFANTTHQPQTVWASRSADFNNFAPSDAAGKVLADSGLNYTLGTDDVNSIRWMVAGKVLTVLTDSGEFTVLASSLYEAVTPTNVRVVRETARGAANVKPVLVDKNLLFWQRARRKLREYLYDFNVDGFRSNDATILSEHITLGGMTSMDYQQEPHSIVWSARTDGQLIGFTYNKEQEVLGWHRHPIAGTDAKVLCVACIPGADADELWVITTRTIDGGTKQYIERLDQEFYPSTPDDKSGAFYVDCGLSYSGAPITLVSGLDHLKGETVTILADGSARASKVVNASGQITLDRAASVIHIGLGYTAKLRSIRYEAGGNEGTSQTKTGRIQRLGLRLLNTLGIKFGPSEDKLQEIQFRMGFHKMDQSPPLFTGDQVVNFPGDYDRGRQVTVVADQPYPCTITGLVPWMVVYE